jgi:hypothetical protein
MAQAVTLCKVSGSDLDRETGYLEVSLGSPPYPLPKSRIFPQLDQGSSRKSIREGDVYWIYLAGDAYRWRFPVNAVMNRQVP